MKKTIRPLPPSSFPPHSCPAWSSTSFRARTSTSCNRTKLTKWLERSCLRNDGGDDDKGDDNVDVDDVDDDNDDNKHDTNDANEPR